MRKLVLGLLIVGIIILVGGLVHYLNSPFQPLDPQSIEQAERAVNTTPASAVLPTTATTPATTSITNPDGLPDRILGNANAPVTMIEYASLTCPHCARFHQDHFAKIKAEFIDTGKVRFIFRPFPFDQVALGGSVLAYCLPETTFYGFLGSVFAFQETWAKAADPLAELRKMAKLAGLTDEKIAACENKDSALPAHILKARMSAEKDYGISSTPSFVINGEVVQGARDYTVFQNAINNALAQAKPAQ